MAKTALTTGVTGQDGAYLSEFLFKKRYIVQGLKRRSSLFHTDRIDYLYQDPHLDNRNFNYEWKGNNPGNYIGILRYFSSSNSRVFGSVILKNSTVSYSASKNFSLFSDVIVS